jgi:hypothetical protein
MHRTGASTTVALRRRQASRQRESVCYALHNQASASLVRQHPKTNSLTYKLTRPLCCLVT